MRPELLPFPQNDRRLFFHMNGIRLQLRLQRYAVAVLVRFSIFSIGASCKEIPGIQLYLRCAGMNVQLSAGRLMIEDDLFIALI